MPIVAVSSPDDTRLLGYHAVSDPELAERDGLFVAEGRMVVRRLLSTPSLVTRSLLLTQPALDGLADILNGRPDVTAFLAPQDVMNGVAGFNIHRGCLALAERPAPRSWQEVAGVARRLVVLEQVGDADNVGSAFRCAAAFDAGGVLLGPSCADPLYRKAIRTSMAATLAVPFAQARPWPDVLTALEANGWHVIGLTPHADEPPLWEAAAGAHRAPTALVFGHEGDGLSAAALWACTHRARIPMAPGVDSLNVGVSVGVALYEISRHPYRGSAIMSAATWDVVGLGENSVDRVLRLPSWPGFGPGAKVRVESLPPVVGGQVVTTLCTCASLGLRAAYVGVVGQDAHGALVRDELTRRGIDIGAVLTREAGTREAVILVEPSGERVVLWSRDAVLALRPSDVPVDLVQRTRVLHVDAVDLDAAVHAAQLARAAGAIVTCDLDDVGDGRAALFEAATHPILAEGVPAALTGEADVVQALLALGRRHPGPICVTRGARGALLLEGGRVHECPAPTVQAVDTTGAGDVFRGAYIAARLDGLAPEHVLRFATAAAAVSCTRVGAVGGVPTRAEIENLRRSLASYNPAL